jgi:hypothetical protein
MKTVLEQLMEVNEKLAELEKAIMGTSTDEVECDGYCGCGCDEPEYDSAGFTEADRTPDSQYMVTTDIDPQDAIVRAQTITFTYDELIDFATRLTRRAVDTCKEAVELVSFSDDDICDVSLNWDRAIEIEIDNERIHKDVTDEIDSVINLDEESVDDEVRDILGDMHLDSIS